jgi:hypothetical protein
MSVRPVNARDRKLCVLRWKVIFTACAFRDGHVGRGAMEQTVDEYRNALLEAERGKAIQ